MVVLIHDLDRVHAIDQEVIVHDIGTVVTDASLISGILMFNWRIIIGFPMKNKKYNTHKNG